MIGTETETGQIEPTREDDRPDVCSTFIRAHHKEILACWEGRVRTLPTARHLDRPSLIDHIPSVLELIADTTEQMCSGVTREHLKLSEAHALERLEAGFDLAEVVIELGMLRNCIIEMLEDVPEPLQVVEFRRLDEAIDATVTATIDRYTQARERTLQTIDRIGSAALASRSLGDLLHRMLEVLVQSSESIQQAAILIREDNVLAIRASVGLAAEVSDRVRVPVGAGFEGTIAATGRPLELPDAATNGLVRPALRDTNVLALYGVPLIEAGEVIAVAFVGSLTANEFTSDDKRLFRAACSRATAAIFQQMLREASEKTAQELREREREFHALADNIPQLAWMTDEHGKAYWYNERWLDYTGTTLDQMRQMDVSQYLHPDHAGRVAQGFRTALTAGQPWEDTFPLRHKTGSYRWFLSRATPIRDEHGKIVHWFGTNTDITRQRFLDEASKLLNVSLNYPETLQQLAELALPDLADWCVVDLVEREGDVRQVAIAHVDPAQLEFAREWVSKYPPDWESPTGVANVIRTGQPEMYSEITDEALVNAARNEEHLLALRKLGLTSCVIAPLLARGRTLGAITLLTTESSQRRYEVADCELAVELGRRAGVAVENARLYNDSQRALHDREEVLRSREEVLAIVSHDLRSPLSAIGMTAGLLAEECEGVDQRKRCELITRSADRMEHMIDDLLEMATIQAKGLTLNRVAEDADLIVTGVIDAHEAKAASKGIHIVRETELSAVRIACDRDLVERVFANLIGNAIKYGTGDVIFVRGRVVEGQALFSVADTGPGVAAEQVPHLFEPYWTGNRKGAKKGTGLGLYISRGIVEAHGGRLWVETAVSKGSEFFFTLPLAEARWRRTMMRTVTDR